MKISEMELDQVRILFDTWLRSLREGVAYKVISDENSSVKVEKEPIQAGREYGRKLVFSDGSWLEILLRVRS